MSVHGPEQREVSTWPLSPQSLPSNVPSRRAPFVERARARPRASTNVFRVSVKSSRDQPNLVSWLEFSQIVWLDAKSAPRNRADADDNAAPASAGVRLGGGRHRSPPRAPSHSANHIALLLTRSQPSLKT